MDKDDNTTPHAEDSKEIETTVTKTLEPKKMDFPFDLNNLFTMQINYNYNFDSLKQAIEYLADQLNSHNKRITELEKGPGKKSQVSFEPDVTIDMHKEHEQRIVDLENRDVALQEQINMLKKMKSSDGGPVDLSWIEDMIQKVKIEQYAKNEDLLKKIKELEAVTKKADDEEQVEIDNMKKLQTAHSEQIESLIGCKTEVKEFQEKTDEIIEMIKNMNIGAPITMPAPTVAAVEIKAAPVEKGPWQQITEADIDKWNKTVQKTDNISTKVEKLIRDTDDLDKMRGYIKDIQTKLPDFALNVEYQKTVIDLGTITKQVHCNSNAIIKMQGDIVWIRDWINNVQFPSVDDFRMLRSRLDISENQINNLRKLIAELEKRIKNMKVGGDTNLQPLLDEMSKLRSEFETHRDQANAHIDQLNQEMPLKAYKTDLLDLEISIMNKLKQTIQQLMGQFANKEETLRKFAQLSKKIRDILEMLKKCACQYQNEDDAMFSKQPYGPVACASCEKNIVNLYGQQADYYAWKKLPFRDQGEQIARYGRGFSKTLSQMKPKTAGQVDQYGYMSQENSPEREEQMIMGQRNRLQSQKQASVDDSYLPSFTNGDGQTNPEQVRSDTAMVGKKASLPTFASTNSPSKQGRSFVRGGKSTAQPGHRRSTTGMSMDNTSGIQQMVNLNSQQQF